MIKPRRIGHATFETPDLEKMIDYYTEVLGLVLVEREKERAFLVTKVGLLAIAINKAERERCAGLSFEVAPDSDFGAMAQELRKHGIASELRNDATPGVGPLLSFQDNKGTTISLFKEWNYLGKHLPHHGIGPLKLGHVAWNVEDPNKMSEFYAGVLGFQGFGLGRRLFRLHALQPRPPHGKLRSRHQRQDGSHRFRGEGLLPFAGILRIARPAPHSNPVGAGAAWTGP